MLSTTVLWLAASALNDSRETYLSSSAPMFCIFGRPGAGKTTVANKVLSLLETDSEEGTRTELSLSLHPIGIDLDVCVPQWMRDNFSAGIYPTLEERLQFAQDACDHVETCLQEATTTSSDPDPQQQPLAIVSFSFVNKDLRDVYRQRFPQTQWILVDTSETEASVRIQQREGHFYREVNMDGQNNQKQKEEKDSKVKEKDSANDNSDWEFAPVDFEHVVLDGANSIDTNARLTVQQIQQYLQRIERVQQQ